jgi:hypothetical protein
MIAVWDEADLLRVGLVRVGQPEAAGDPRTSALVLSPRESAPGPALGANAEQEIRLILVAIEGREAGPAAPICNRA